MAHPVVERMRQDGFEQSLDGLSLFAIQDLIDKSDSAYYRTHASILTDAEYDCIKSHLKSHYPDDERCVRVGHQFSVDELRTKVKHNIPMGSLDNTENGVAGLSSWVDSMTDVLSVAPAIFSSLKIDGASICATYRDGKLVRVATRGNGEIGDDITVNGMNFIGLPTNLTMNVDADVRGEAILYKSDFEAICVADKILEEDKSNPRNVGNGIIGRDSGVDSDRIRFIAFNIESDIVFDTEVAKMAFLKKLGFKHVPYTLCSDVAEFMVFYDCVVSGRNEFPFEIDGIVVVVNSIEQQLKFITNDIKSRLRPKYAKAVKFPHKSNATILEAVYLSVGHTGVVIPTALLKETRVGGVNVTHALLNNWDEIRRLDIAINDEVEVVLAGDIIPKIIRKISNGNPRVDITEPTVCPTCGSATSRNYRGKDGANVYCTNNTCDAKLIGKIDHWIGNSKKGVGVLGIGDIILNAMWKNGVVKDPSDLYKITIDSIKDLKLDGEMRVGASRAHQIVTNINGKRNLPLHVFLGALGIDLLGSRRVQILSDASDGKLAKLENWLDSSVLSTIVIPGFGDIIREAVVAGIDDNRVLIQKLLDAGVTITSEGENIESGESVSMSCESVENDVQPFDGFTFCLTGTRAHIDDITRLGGVIKSGVSRGLTFLVQADPLSVSGKTRKAEEYGTSIISIDYLKQAINGEVVLKPSE